MVDSQRAMMANPSIDRDQLEPSRPTVGNNSDHNASSSSAGTTQNDKTIDAQPELSDIYIKEYVIDQMIAENYANDEELYDEFFDDNFLENDGKFSFFKMFRIMCARVYLTVDVETSSSVAYFISLILKAAIITSVFSFIAQAEPSMKYYPHYCDTPVCNDDPVLCPGRTVCEGESAPALAIVDLVCIVIFTVEYGLRLFTAWAVSPRVAGILPWNWDRLHRHGDAQPEYNVLMHMARWLVMPWNVIDVACFIPFYILVAFGNSLTSSFVRVLRILRLLRVLRMIRFVTLAQHTMVMFEMVITTFRRSMPVLMVFLFFSLLGQVFFSCLIHTFEMGTFTVTADYPEGVYLRPTINQASLEISPFTSISASMYWAVVTGTTTGYGDIAPTTAVGRAIAVILMFLGVFAIALPVGVLGANFTREYGAHFAKVAKQLEDKKKQQEDEIETLRQLANEASNLVAGRGLDHSGGQSSLHLKTYEPSREAQELLNQITKMREAFEEAVDELRSGIEEVKKIADDSLSGIVEEVEKLDAKHSAAAASASVAASEDGNSGLIFSRHMPSMAKIRRAMSIKGSDAFAHSNSNSNTNLYSTNPSRQQSSRSRSFAFAPSNDGDGGGGGGRGHGRGRGGGRDGNGNDDGNDDEDAHSNVGSSAADNRGDDRIRFKHASSMAAIEGFFTHGARRSYSKRFKNAPPTYASASANVSASGSVAGSHHGDDSHSNNDNDNDDNRDDSDNNHDTSTKSKTRQDDTATSISNPNSSTSFKSRLLNINMQRFPTVTGIEKWISKRYANTTNMGKHHQDNEDEGKGGLDNLQGSAKGSAKGGARGGAMGERGGSDKISAPYRRNSKSLIEDLEEYQQQPGTGTAGAALVNNSANADYIPKKSGVSGKNAGGGGLTFGSSAGGAAAGGGRGRGSERGRGANNSGSGGTVGGSYPNPYSNSPTPGNRPSTSTSSSMTSGAVKTQTLPAPPMLLHAAQVALESHCGSSDYAKSEVDETQSPQQSPQQPQQQQQQPQQPQPPQPQQPTIGGHRSLSSSVIYLPIQVKKSLSSLSALGGATRRAQQLQQMQQQQQQGNNRGERGRERGGAAVAGGGRGMRGESSRDMGSRPSFGRGIGTGSGRANAAATFNSAADSANNWSREAKGGDRGGDKNSNNLEDRRDSLGFGIRGDRLVVSGAERPAATAGEGQKEGYRHSGSAQHSGGGGGSRRDVMGGLKAAQLRSDEVAGNVKSSSSSSPLMANKKTAASLTSTATTAASAAAAAAELESIDVCSDTVKNNNEYGDRYNENDNDNDDDLLSHTHSQHSHSQSMHSSRATEVPVHRFSTSTQRAEGSKTPSHTQSGSTQSQAQSSENTKSGWTQSGGTQPEPTPAGKSAIQYTYSTSSQDTGETSSKTAILHAHMHHAPTSMKKHAPSPPQTVNSADEATNTSTYSP